MTTRQTNFKSAKDVTSDFRNTCTQIIKADLNEAVLINEALVHGGNKVPEFFALTDRMLATAEYYIEHTKNADFASLMSGWRDRTNAKL